MSILTTENIFLCYYDKNRTPNGLKHGKLCGKPNNHHLTAEKSHPQTKGQSSATHPRF